MLIAWLIACATGGPQSAEPVDWESFAPRELDASTGDLSDIPRPGPQDQWTYGGVFDGAGYQHGRWISHPPIEFAVELLGADFVDQCVRKMRNKREPASLCVVRLPPCRQLRISRDGSVEYEIEAVNCGLDTPPDDPHDRLRWKYVQ